MDTESVLSHLMRTVKTVVNEGKKVKSGWRTKFEDASECGI